MSLSRKDGVPDPTEVSNCYGAILIGAFLSLMLYGLSLHQVYEYAIANDKDPLRKKLYVLIIMSLSTFQSVLSSHVSYYELVITSSFWKTFWSFDLQALTSGSITIACQSYYIYRLYQLSKRCRIVAIIAICLLLTELGLSIAVTVYCFQSKHYSDSHIALVTRGTGVAAVTNVILTVTLVLYLRHRRTGFEDTNSWLTFLVRYTLSTGMLVTLFSVLVFILSLLETNRNWWYIALEVVGSKLYVNIVLAMINLPQHHLFATQERASLGINLAGRPSLQLSTWFAAAKPAEDRRRSKILEARSPTMGIEINVTHEFVQEISDPEPMSRSNTIMDEDIVLFIA